MTTKRKAANLVNGANGNPEFATHGKGNVKNQDGQIYTGSDVVGECKYDTLEVWPVVGLIRLYWHGPNEEPAEPVRAAYFYSNPSNWAADTMRLAITERVDSVIFNAPDNVDTFDDAIDACAQCLRNLNINVCFA